MNNDEMMIGGNSFDIEFADSKRRMQMEGIGADDEWIHITVTQKSEEAAIRVCAFRVGRESIFAGMEHLIASGADGFTYGDIDSGVAFCRQPLGMHVNNDELSSIVDRFLERYGGERSKVVPAKV